MHNYQQGLNEAHNGYLEIWLTLGWIGVFLLMALILQGYRRIGASYRQDANTGMFKLAFFLSAIVAGFTEAAYQTASISWIALLVITMAAPRSQGEAA
jgi:O-antigen ligase